MKIKDTFKPGEYGSYVKKQMPKSEIPGNLFKAFWVGGAICTVGEAFRQFAGSVIGLDEEDALQRGFSLAEVAPPQGDDAAVLSQMIRTLGARA